MQLLILVLFVGLFMHDAIRGGPPDAATNINWAISSAWCLALFLIPKLLIGAAYHLLCRRAVKKMVRGKSTAPVRRLDRIAGVHRPLVSASYLIDLFALDILLRLRLSVDLVLVDELLIMLPTLALTAWMWMAYYPVDVRMRQATFMSRIERGEPVHIWSRGQFMLSQVRHQWALMGLPLLILTGWWESVSKVYDNRGHDSAQAALMMSGAFVVFLFTPVMIRHVWDTVPLPAGPLRETLMGMCRQYRVGVRELLLWRTFGGMINGAVMGLIGPLRYILLTDGLLETMPARQVEAVMAHELAHVRKHHMFWLLAVAASSMELLRGLTEMVIGRSLATLASDAMPAWLPQPVVAAIGHPDTPQVLAIVVSMIAWFFIFGWVSRRFERQADTFAVQHLARQWHENEKAGTNESSAAPPPLPTADQIFTALEQGDTITIPLAQPVAVPVEPGHIPPAAAEVMASALQTVADLNCIPARRRSWRHGSIAWRQNYLRSLRGTPIESTSIDRQVRWIKLAGAAILATAVAVQVMR